MTQKTTKKYFRLSTFIALFLLGSLGTVASAFFTATHADLFQIPGEEVPLSVMITATVIQSSILLAVLVAIGLWCAPKVGLRSLLVDKLIEKKSFWEELKHGLKPALLIGAGLGAVIVAASFLAPQTANTELSTGVAAIASDIGLRLFQGGITEEILLRWGVMSFLVFLLVRIFARGSAKVPQWAIWTGIVLSALIFSLMHFPGAEETLGVESLTTITMAAIFVGNLLGGIGFGWLFWRYSLETAMIGHMFAHVVVIAILPLLLAV